VERPSGAGDVRVAPPDNRSENMAARLERHAASERASMCHVRRLCLLLCAAAVVLVSSGRVSAQRETIPELVARGGVSSAATVPSGQMPALAALLERTDLLVTGTLGAPHSYLSNDQTDVLTDYPLIDPIVLFLAKPRVSRTAGVHPPLTLTQKGGTVTVNGVAFTEKQPALEPLQPGSKVLCLLESVGDKNVIVGAFFGIFSIEGGRLNPLMTRPDFAQDYRGVEYDAAVESMLSVLRARRE
jgi:hypothetical protein